jgi:hypothetical protein
MTQLTNAEVRLERAFRRLGTRNPMCACCPENYPHALELHHVAGQTHHDDTVILCRNCHRKLSDAQIDRSDWTAPDPRIETIGHYLCGLADLFRLIAEALATFGEWLLGQRAAIEPETVR